MAGKLNVKVDHALVAAYMAAIFGAIAVVAAIQAAREAGAQSRTLAEEAVLNAQVALVRSCGTFSASLFKTGDDLLQITGSNGSADYTSEEEASEFRSAISKRPKSFVRCQFTNYSRVPLLTVAFYGRIAYHRGRKQTTEHNFPFAALAPGDSRFVWFLNTDNEPVVVRTPDRARYARFPRLGEYQNQQFEPVLSDYWILRRSDDAKEHLDQSMM